MRSLVLLHQRQYGRTITLQLALPYPAHCLEGIGIPRAAARDIGQSSIVKDHVRRHVLLRCAIAAPDAQRLEQRRIARSNGRAIAAAALARPAPGGVAVGYSRHPADRDTAFATVNGANVISFSEVHQRAAFVGVLT